MKSFTIASLYSISWNDTANRKPLTRFRPLYFGTVAFRVQWLKVSHEQTGTYTDIQIERHTTTYAEIGASIKICADTHQDAPLQEVTRDLCIQSMCVIEFRKRSHSTIALREIGFSNLSILALVKCRSEFERQSFLIGSLDLWTLFSSRSLCILLSYLTPSGRAFFSHTPQ